MNIQISNTYHHRPIILSGNSKKKYSSTKIPCNCMLRYKIRFVNCVNTFLKMLTKVIDVDFIREIDAFPETICT